MAEEIILTCPVCGRKDFEAGAVLQEGDRSVMRPGYWQPARMLTKTLRNPGREIRGQRCRTCGYVMLFTSPDKPSDR
ncbi:MAG: hypothetical protein AAF125_05565 [Chloroflexota bacterium]